MPRRSRAKPQRALATLCPCMCRAPSQLTAGLLPGSTTMNCSGCDGPRELRGEGLACRALSGPPAPLRGFRRKRTIEDPPTALQQRIPEVTHRREENDDARLRHPDLLGFTRDLGHPDGIRLQIESIKSRRPLIELIAEDEDEISEFRSALHGFGLATPAISFWPLRDFFDSKGIQSSLRSVKAGY